MTGGSSSSPPTFQQTRNIHDDDDAEDNDAVDIDDTDDGWDHPPPVAFPSSSSSDGTSFGWQVPTRLTWKTSQRIASFCPSSSFHTKTGYTDDKTTNNKEDMGSADKQQHDEEDVDGDGGDMAAAAAAAVFDYGNLFCAPIIIGGNDHHQQVVVVAMGRTLFLYSCDDNNNTYSGATRLFDGVSSSDDTSCPQLPNHSTGPLTQLSLLDDDTSNDTTLRGGGRDIQQMVFHEASKILYVLTVDSFIFQIQVVMITTTTTTPTSNKTSSSSPKTTTTTAAGAAEATAITTTEKELQGNSNTTTTTHHHYSLKLLSRFHTKEYGATCMATLRNGIGSDSASSNNKDDQVDVICVGYSSGMIEAWSVNVATQQQQQQTIELLPMSQSPVVVATTRTRQKRLRRPKTTSASLQWRGYLYQSIQTLAFLPRPLPTQHSETKPQQLTHTNDPVEEEAALTTSASPPSVLMEQQDSSIETVLTSGPPSPPPLTPISRPDPIHNHYLVVSMQILTGTTNENGDQHQQQQQPTSSLVDILDVSRIFLAAGDTTTTTTTAEQDRNSLLLALEEFAIPQTPGMELVDCGGMMLPFHHSHSQVDHHLPKRSRVLLAGPSADAATRLWEEEDTNSTTTGIRKNPRLCLTLPDGTVALFSCHDDPRMSGAVGIAEDFHQQLLPFPAIGSGKVKLPMPMLLSSSSSREGGEGHSNDKCHSSTFVACCSRSGTCYLIPTTNGDVVGLRSAAMEVFAVPFPHDVSTDLDSIYIQAFTAGNLLVNGVSTPVLVFAWPTGVVDVYACGLVMQAEASSCNIALIKGQEEGLEKEDFVPRAERRALEEMIDNGAAEGLLTILKEMREDQVSHPLLQTEEWQGVWNDKSLLTTQTCWSVEMLCSKEFRHVRLFLLSMASAAGEVKQ